MATGADLTPEASAADHVRGSLDAPVVITEFADFECSYCGDAFDVLEAIREKYLARIALVFRHYPLSMHPHAAAAAEAAEAAGQAGKFWEMHDKLFHNQQALTKPNLLTFADAIGVDADAVESAIERRTYRGRIDRDVKSGDLSGVEGTPALFVNGCTYDGDVSVQALSAVIDRALTPGTEATV